MEVPEQLVCETIELIKVYIDSLPLGVRQVNAQSMLMEYQDIVREEKKN